MVYPRSNGNQASKKPYNYQGRQRNDSYRSNTPENSLWGENASSSKASTSTVRRNTASGHSASMPSASNSIFNQSNDAVVRASGNPFNMTNQGNVEEEKKRRIQNLAMLPYLDRRGLKALLSANPRFHLIEFKGVPKFIKTSVFLGDLIQAMSEIVGKSIISIHSHVNSSSNDLVDYKIGFNNVKIISRLQEVLGTGSFSLYKTEVQVVFPDLTAMSDCEYNRVVGDDFFTNGKNSPYKLSHASTHLLEVVIMLERVCLEKFWSISSICCNGENSFINLTDPSVVFCLNGFAHECQFVIEPSETTTFTGTIPSELLPIEGSPNTPINSASTAPLTPTELVKFDGFKAIFATHATNTRTALSTMIKRSLVESQACTSARMNNFEARIIQELLPLKNSASTFRAQLDLFANQLKSIDDKIDNLANVLTSTNDLLGKFVNKRDDKKKIDKLSKRMSIPDSDPVPTGKVDANIFPQHHHQTSAVNPSKNGTTALLDDIDDDILNED